MSLVAGLSHALTGIQDAKARFNQAAARIADPESTASDLARDLVETKMAVHAVAANVAVGRNVDEVIGSLLDLVA